MTLHADDGGENNGTLMVNDSEPASLKGFLRSHGISRRDFLKYGVTLTSLLALPTSALDFWDAGGFYQALRLEKAAAEVPRKEAPSSAARGQVVFTNNCSCCHLPGPVPFSTAPEQVPQRLRDPRIRAHRFQISDRQIADLVNYLKELAKRR
jgi:mono/diheme cytochrome c family protein